VPLALLNEAAFKSAPSLYDADSLLIDASFDTIHALDLSEPCGQVTKVDPVPGLTEFLLNKTRPRADEFELFVRSGRPAAIILSRQVFMPGGELAFDSWAWWAEKIAGPWIYGAYPAAVETTVTAIESLQPMAGAYRKSEPTKVVIRWDPAPTVPVWSVVAATPTGEPVCVILNDHPNVALLAGVPAGGVPALLSALSGWAVTCTTPIWESPWRRAATAARGLAEQKLRAAREEEVEAAEQDRRLLERRDVARAVALYCAAATALPNTPEVASRLFNFFEIAEQLLGVGKGRLHTILPISANQEERVRKTANHPPYNARHASVIDDAPATAPEDLLKDGRIVLDGLLDHLAVDPER
jgi:hypothetical protein